MLIASVGDLFDPLARMSVLAKAGLAGLAALLAVAKGLLARRVGDPDSASLVDVHDLRHRDHT